MTWDSHVWLCLRELYSSEVISIDNLIVNLDLNSLSGGLSAVPIGSVPLVWVRPNRVFTWFTHPSLQVTIESDLGLLGLEKVRHLWSLHTLVLLGRRRVVTSYTWQLRMLCGILRLDSLNCSKSIWVLCCVERIGSTIHTMWLCRLPMISHVDRWIWGRRVWCLLESLEELPLVLDLLCLRHLGRKLYKSREELQGAGRVMVESALTCAKGNFCKIERCFLLKVGALRVYFIETRP